MPDMFIIAGPNGSGKSTIYPAIKSVKREEWSFEPDTISDSNFVNADDIEKSLKSGDIQAARVAIKKIKGFIKNKESFSVESTLSGMTLLKHIEEATKNGFRVFTIYILVESAELSMVRVTQRALLGRHYISMQNIVARYNRSVCNFFNRYKSASDFWLVADNSKLEVKLLCWGGKRFGSNAPFAEDRERITCLNQIFKRNDLDLAINEDVVNTRDNFTPVVIRKFQSYIEKELRNRPEGNYVSISDNGVVKFKKVEQ